jgi:hypothetical protein
MAEPVHVSTVGFSNMEAAYTAGQAAMREILLAQSTARMSRDDHWDGYRIDGMATVPEQPGHPAPLSGF